MDELVKLQMLEEGNECTLNWSEGGGGLVTRKGDQYHLEYAPQYGGEPHLQGIYERHEFDKMIEIANKWT